MKVSGTGALVGAAVGAVARSAVVLLNLGDQVPVVFVVPSAVIGVFVGLIAGGIGKPAWGAAVGAVLSAVVFELFMLPCASLIGTFGSLTGNSQAQGKFLQGTVIYAAEMGIAGLLAGAVGGWLGYRSEHSQKKANDSVTGATPSA